MDVLVVNAGSTSLKLDLVSPDETSRRIDSYAEVGGDVGAVGHRIVHGGARFKAPVVIDEAVEREVADLALIAPLHNTPALQALEEARRALPDVPHVAVFDTAFHASIPDEAAVYAVPSRWREEWGVRRFGFHGLSVQWSAERVRAPRLVVCHLGGGCSVTAVLDGRSVDTSMGFTPLEGVPMAARSGSVDPGALLFLLRERFLTLDELDHALEHESGLKALGGLESPLGLGVYTHRIAAAVAGMASALGGLDALVFTAGVGENVSAVRAEVCRRLGFLGIELDAAANESVTPDTDISAAGSRVRVAVVRAREEVVVARAVRALS
ncbi:MAG: acetate/propionate family kinase [Actinobacteria bacterium]|nr:acetate/propionate family kinase [Actinomycetota bacterium]